ncbi:MAG TPA: hypothetical protein VJR02_18170 [Pyrinomonadaceae bacterium]|nr:hypothetical protein [Pyrinomonadaceae bacterium]
MNATDHEIDQRAQDADEQFHYTVVEDAASMPDGCLGVIVFMFAVGIIAKLLL